MNAEEIMTTKVASVRSTDKIGRAVQLLGELDVRHLPVMDDGELVGMLSDRDLRELGLYRVENLDDLDRAKSVRRMAVSDAMNGDVVSAEPSTDVRELIDMMIEEKVGALPVVDRHTGSLVGIVSYVDVLRAAAQLL